MSHKHRLSPSRSNGEVPSTERMFNPSRLAVARKRRGLTKIGFAKRIGVALRSYKAYELGEYPPSDETVEQMASVSGFPVDFFFGDVLDEPRSDTASFRSMSRMKASQRAMALSQGTIALHVNQWLEKRFELPEVDLPNLGEEDSPEAAAEALRHHWRIGELPVSNMIHLLESKGVRIFSLAIEAREVDAFSMWKEDVPFIFLNCKKSSERSRYDAAHELGHLVLHRHGGPRGKDAEQEANAFAAAFLMPRASVLAHAPRFPTLATLIGLKSLWKTSVAALCHRLHDVNMLTEWQYRMLYIQISKSRFRTQEPNPAPRETSIILPEIFSALRKEGISRAKAARELTIPEEELECLMFGLTMAAVKGGGRSTPGRSRLALVNKN
jgi:Zn-dependent peptidase ImmA (M78 family)/transcriptional regulator with XRE-family HTH domain